MELWASKLNSCWILLIPIPSSCFFCYLSLTVRLNRSRLRSSWTRLSTCPKLSILHFLHVEMNFVSFRFSKTFFHSVQCDIIISPKFFILFCSFLLLFIVLDHCGTDVVSRFRPKFTNSNLHFPDGWIHRELLKIYTMIDAAEPSGGMLIHLLRGASDRSPRLSWFELIADDMSRLGRSLK